MSSHDQQPYRDEKHALRHQLAKAEDELAVYRAQEAALSVTCPNCQAANAPSAGFCSSCGAALQAADPRQLAHLRPRNVILVAVLSVITFSLYNIYLVYAWTKEINGALGEQRRSAGLAVLLSIVTFGLGALVYECLIARDLHILSARARRPLLNPTLEKLVLGLNVAALVLNFIGVTAPIGMICGTIATALVQKELNHLAAGSARAGATPEHKALPAA